MNYYLTDPALREYYLTLPEFVQMSLVESGVEISTLGELKQVAEHMMKS